MFCTHYSLCIGNPDNVTHLKPQGNVSIEGTSNVVFQAENGEIIIERGFEVVKKLSLKQKLINIQHHIMKKFLLLTGLFICISLSASSQGELPFYESRWTYQYKQQYIIQNALCFYTQGDTIIDAIPRTKLYAAADNNNKSYLVGFFHEIEKKIYFRYENDEENHFLSGSGFYGMELDADKDYLYFDFSLEEGDEFTLPTEDYEIKRYIHEVDSVTIGEEKRKRYAIKNDPDSDWVSDY